MVIGLKVRAGPWAVLHCPAITRTRPAPSGSSTTGICAAVMGW